MLERDWPEKRNRNYSVQSIRACIHALYIPLYLRQPICIIVIVSDVFFNSPEKRDIYIYIYYYTCELLVYLSTVRNGFTIGDRYQLVYNMASVTFGIYLTAVSFFQSEIRKELTK